MPVSEYNHILVAVLFFVSFFLSFTAFKIGGRGAGRAPPKPRKRVMGGGVALGEAGAQLSELGFRHLVYTDIARDGMQAGIDVAAYRHVAEVAGFPVVASGGISTLDDIRALAAVGEGAIEGAITGRALYEGNFTLAQALAAARGEE